MLHQSDFAPVLVIGNKKSVKSTKVKELFWKTILYYQIGMTKDESGNYIQHSVSQI